MKYYNFKAFLFFRLEFLILVITDIDYVIYSYLYDEETLNFIIPIIMRSLRFGKLLNFVYFLKKPIKNFITGENY